MSSELERLLREAREALPDPDDATTGRARKRALAAIRRRRPRARVVALLGATLVGAVALGVGLGSLVAPSGTAAREPSGLGFVPEPGWFALQSPPPAVPGQPAVAVAANVPVAPDDVVRGFVDSPGFPYSTLLTLPPRGVVMVAAMTPRREQPLLDDLFRKTELPLRVQDAVQYIQYAAQVRPEQPLAQYQLRAEVRGYNVDLTIYFGTSIPSRALRAKAQRQLRRLTVPATVTGSSVTPTTTVQRSTVAQPNASRTIDRSFSCSVSLRAGVRLIEVSATSGFRDPEDRSRWRWLASAGIGTRDGFLVGVSAGAPLSLSDPAYPGATPQTRWLSINPQTCKPTTARAALSAKGLIGGSASQLQGSDAYECATTSRAIVRVRAVFRTATTLRVQRLYREKRLTTATAAVIREAQLAVGTQSGKPLAYATASESGKARLFTAPSCVPD